MPRCFGVRLVPYPQTQYQEVENPTRTIGVWGTLELRKRENQLSVLASTSASRNTFLLPRPPTSRRPSDLNPDRVAIYFPFPGRERQVCYFLWGGLKAIAPILRLNAPRFVGGHDPVSPWLFKGRRRAEINCRDVTRGWRQSYPSLQDSCGNGIRVLPRDTIARIFFTRHGFSSEVPYLKSDIRWIATVPCKLPAY